MIGRLKCGNAVLTLNDEIEWSCPDDPARAETFNLLFGMDSYQAADGIPGFALFYRAAEEMECEILDAPVVDDSPTSEGLVY